ncbi:site-specific integrase [Vicingaceae bacterium]|nr:site-specific integrase [Vicingaceae bacterium]
MSTKVKVRTKSITKGRKSLFLDFYPPIINPKNGKETRREFLGLYVFDKPKNPFDRKHNVETLFIANSIRQKRENNLNKPEIYTEHEKEQLAILQKGEQSFLDYYKKLASDKAKGVWSSAFSCFKRFAKGDVRFSQIDKPYMDEFKQYLLTHKSLRTGSVALSTNSASTYFSLTKTALKQAYRDEIIAIDISSKLDGIKMTEVRRDYLTVDELNSLVKTDCSNLQVKNSALFSALTGLRFSDIQKMVWSEVEHVEGQGYFLNFTQKKTKGIEYYPISEQAFNLLGERGRPEDKIFKGLNYSSWLNKQLFRWVVKAGITKDITFHNFRHSFATLQLFNGTDLFTVSKMLGHKDIQSTQVYAKVVDESKRIASDRIKLDFD